MNRTSHKITWERVEGQRSHIRLKPPSNVKTPEQVLEEKIDELHRKSDWRGLAWRLVITAAVVYLIFGRIFGIAVVRENSMYPNIKAGDIVFFNRLGKNNVGDIVILHANNEEDYIKRVAATAGNVVDIDNTGILRVNGDKVNEQYIFSSTYPRESGITFPVTITEGKLFALGDNREISKDSREMGLIDEKKVIGKVVLVMRFNKGSK